MYAPRQPFIVRPSNRSFQPALFSGEVSVLGSAAVPGAEWQDSSPSERAKPRRRRFEEAMGRRWAFIRRCYFRQARKVKDPGGLEELRS
jgi:hypothetical protein